MRRIELQAIDRWTAFNANVWRENAR
jgi:hypothetical protein